MDIQFPTLDFSLIKGPCTQCVSGDYMLLVSQRHLLNKYYDKFNFYFAKPVNEILAKCKESHVILFNDYQYYDQSVEYIEQLYKQNDARAKLKIISNQKQQMTKPKICLVRQAETIERRYRKLQKLKRKQSFNRQQINEDIPQEILRSLDSNGASNKSFDSSVHDIYDQSYHKPTSQLIDLKYKPSLNIKLWESDDNEDVNDLLDRINQTQKSKIYRISNQLYQDISPFLKKSILHPSLPTLQLKELMMNEDYQKRRRKPALNLNLNQIQSPNLMQLMQQYSKNSRRIEIQTERGHNYYQDEAKKQKDIGFSQAKSVSPINKLKDKYQAQQMYSVMIPDRSQLKRQIRNKLILNKPNKDEKTFEKIPKKKPEQESEKLLKMLRMQNMSLPVSPRRLEIKFSLNKLILEQQTTMKSQLQDSIIENSYGFLTSRNSKQDIGAFRSLASLNFSKKYQKPKLLLSPKSKK